MAVVQFAGAEHGLSSTSLTLEESPQSNCSVVTSPVRTGSYAYRVLTSTTTAVGAHLFNGIAATGVVNGTSANLATFYVGFGFRYATKSTAATGEEIADMRIVGGTKGQIRLNSNGTLAVYDNSATLVATGTTVLAADTWHWIEYKGTTSASPSSYELRINGTTELSGTMAQGSSNFFGVRLGKTTNRNSTVVDYYFDDVVITDDAFLGTGWGVEALVAEAHGSAMGWTSGTGASDYTQVNERPASSSNYVKTTAAASALFRPVRMDVATIKAAKVVVAISDDTSLQTGSIKVRLTSGATSSDTTAYNGASTSWEALNKVYETDPATSTTWHYRDLNDCEFGVVEANAINERLHFAAVMVLRQATDPGVNLPPLELVAQETGLGEGNNPYVTDSEFVSGNAPPLINDTVKYGALAADLAFAWDMGLTPAKVGIITGDAFGTRWKGPFTTVTTTGTGSTTVASGSNGADLAAVSSLAVVSNNLADPATEGTSYLYAYVQRASDGRRLYFRYSGYSGGSYTGVVFITASSSGATTVTTGDTVAQATDWRGSTFATSTTADLSAGYLIDAMLPTGTGGVVSETIPGTTHSADNTAPGDSFRTYTESADVTVSAVTVASWTVTITCSADHGVTRRGQVVKLSGVSSPDTDLNKEFEVARIVSPRILQAYWIGHADVASTTGASRKIRVASQPAASVKSPTDAIEVTRVPTGACAVPGVGAAGATRQFVFFFSGTHWVAGVLTNFLGIAYSDDAGATWTTASGSGTVAAGSNGQQIGSLTSGQLVGSGLTELPTSGTVEVDTSGGTAMLAYTGRTGSTLTGVTVVSGTSTWTVATGNGIRYALIANNATFTDKFQFVWPWRHSDGYVYLLATDGGYRWAEAYMARVAEASVLDVSAWRYWDGSSWGTSRTAAKPVFGNNQNTTTTGAVNALVGEPSFMYHPGLAKWITSYYDQALAKFVIRLADNPQGPWTRRQVVCDPANYFGSLAYGGMLHPWSGRAPNGTNSLFFHVSLYEPYATFLMKASIGPVDASAAARGRTRLTGNAQARAASAAARELPRATTSPRALTGTAQTRERPAATSTARAAVAATGTSRPAAATPTWRATITAAARSTATATASIRTRLAAAARAIFRTASEGHEVAPARNLDTTAGAPGRRWTSGRAAARWAADATSSRWTAGDPQD